MPDLPAYHPDVRHTRLGPLFYDAVRPAAFPETKLRFRNQRWAEQVGLGALSDADWIRHFARFEPLPDNLPEPLALRYHGHQFQHYNPDIGDGRGFLFAQLRDGDGRLLDLATKGSGRTPYSRSGDGRLTLKGAVREALATEMLEALGGYTSKTFSIIETGEDLERHDEPSPTRSAVLVRLGHSHVRIGTFQRLMAKGEHEALGRLVDYVIEHYWPQAADAADRPAAMLRLVSLAVAEMAAEWMVAGFVHGVLNTDNTVVTGESFDYGPWRFLPTYEPGFTAAYFDHGGLYAFGRQHQALLWNLARLAECLTPLTELAPLKASLEAFWPAFQNDVARHLHRRLGVSPAPATSETEGEGVALTADFFAALRTSGAAFERAFFDLAGGAHPERLAASPQANIYAEEPWASVIAQLRPLTPVPGAEAALAEPYAARAAPATLLIEEVEALWDPIAERDDWSAFEQKIEDIRAAGRFYARLGSKPRRAYD